jgi:hypothetical protein
MCIYGMWPWKVPKWPWFWAEVAVNSWRDLATLLAIVVDKSILFYFKYFIRILGIN